MVFPSGLVPRGLVLRLAAWAAAVFGCSTTELVPVLFTTPVVLRYNVPNARLRLSGRECCPQSERADGSCLNVAL